MSLRLKLLLWYTGVFAVSGALLVTTLYLLIAHRMRSDVGKFLEDEYEEYARLTLQLLDKPELLEETVREETGKGDRYYPLVYRLVDTRAERDLLFLMNPDRRATLRQAAPIHSPLRERFYSFVRLSDGNRPYHVLTGPLDPENHPELVLQVGLYARLLDKRTASLRAYLFVVLAFVVLVAALGGWFLAARSLRPIDELATELSGIESSSLATRLQVGAAADEIDRLRRAINRMLERLELAFDTLRSFTADAAHELRTPLAALHCRLEVAINKPRSEGDARDALSDALEQVAELGALVANLLFIARMDARPGLADAEPVDLGALLADVAEPFALLAEQKGVALSVKCEGELTGQGNPVMLRRLFGNLLDNAVRHTPTGGSVEVRAATDREGCQVTVTDTGVGIEPAALERIFERFYRADESRSRAGGGAGLGLSIVQRIVQLHGGQIHVASQPGRGTTMHVWLPRHLPGDPGAGGGQEKAPGPQPAAGEE